MKLTKIAIFLIIFSTNLFSQKMEEIPQLGKIIADYGVSGSILIYNPKDNMYKGYDLNRCKEAFIPASTFKIPNTLIALETGVVTTDHIFQWDKKEKPFKAWEKDMNIEEAFKTSCVPVYQQIAQMIGLEKMKHYIKILDYGKMDINEDNLITFWLEGNSKITSFEQIAFLQKLYNLKFPVSKEAMETTKKIMISEETEEYKISSKTGTNREGLAWYVGYIETQSDVYFFATNIFVPSKKINSMEVRKNLTRSAFKIVGIIK